MARLARPWCSGSVSVKAREFTRVHVQTLLCQNRPVSLATLGLLLEELRHNVAICDGWYVALAEALDLPLATLDERLAKADGPKCRFLTPDSNK